MLFWLSKKAYKLTKQAYKLEAYKTFAWQKDWWSLKSLIGMFLKLLPYWIIWYLFVGFKTIILCSVHSIHFMKYVLSAKYGLWKGKVESWNMNHKLLNQILMLAWNCKKNWFTQIFNQLWATVMAKSHSDRYERSYFHKIWMEYYWLGENHASRTLSSKFIRCKNPY